MSIKDEDMKKNQYCTTSKCSLTWCDSHYVF